MIKRFLSIATSVVLTVFGASSALAEWRLEYDPRHQKPTSASARLHAGTEDMRMGIHVVAGPQKGWWRISVDKFQGLRLVQLFTISEDTDKETAQKLEQLRGQIRRTQEWIGNARRENVRDFSKSMGVHIGGEWWFGVDRDGKITVTIGGKNLTEQEFAGFVHMVDAVAGIMARLAGPAAQVQAQEEAKDQKMKQLFK